MEKTIKRRLRIALLGSALAAVSCGVIAADFEDCRAIKDAEERLACYDSQSGVTQDPVPAAAPPVVDTAPEPVALPKPAADADSASDEAAVSDPLPASAAATSSETPDVLDDSIGKEQIQERRDEDEIFVAGHVNRCQESNTGHYHFYFDNGQIWLQKDNKRIRWEECDFDVTISKDFFGYKMSPVGDKRTIRISRIK